MRRKDDIIMKETRLIKIELEMMKKKFRASGDDKTIKSLIEVENKILKIERAVKGY